MRSSIFIVALSAQIVLCWNLLAEPMIPLTLVEPAVEAAKREWPDNADMRRVFMSSYCTAFLDAWRYGSEAENIGKSKMIRAGYIGYEAGMHARHHELKDVRITPAEFGYTTASIEGTFKSNMEISHFLDETTGETFYLNRGAIQLLPNSKVRITAWVSPEAKLGIGPERLLGYGHMGLCKRELIPIQIEK